ncbi:uncharacterized protein B0T23DRAFT_36744 [Neurospora hispaniola]|uniref:Uncharacterized protein n=1 Tax=Neurospora hispaniola TaxID=588809 RepID=A0AAJ0MVW3_9PEZI|nr:hypothetical protein B0T23DRAFT_36744 [Neurospora hispaniola]
MGVETKKKSSERPLPVPSATESSIMSPTQSELGTEDKSSYSLPEDGTPVTIKTHNRGKSQTSLLIEYFEGGKGAPSGDGRKPSVRVRLTPSHKSNRKSSGSSRGRIEITEAKSTRRSSQSRRADRHSQSALARSENELMSVLSGGDEDNNSYASATEESSVSRNIEIEIGERSERSANRRPRRPASPLIPSADSKNSYNAGNTSDISAIPSDSFLDEPYVSRKNSDVKSPGSRSVSPSRGGDALAGAGAGITAAAVTDKLRTKSRDESRNREYERGEREKVSVTKTRGDKEKSGSNNRLHKSTKSRTSSLSKEERSSKRSESPRRRSKQSDSMVSGADSSMLSTAAPSQRSVGAESMRSGQSKASSINNPKLLETVEDAIRRLILPELNALKREQSLRQDRKAASTTSSATTASRDEGSDRRRTSRADRNSGTTPTPKEPIKIEKRDREARNAFDESPAQSALSQDTRSDVHDIDHSPTGSADRLKTAAAGAAAAHDSVKSPGENRSRRRRRELRNSAGNEYEDYDDDASSDFLAPAPPMPLLSDLNPSDVTRASILSADTDGPHSASEEIAPKQDQNGQYHTEDSTPTPTRTPITLLSLGTQHANISHGDLKQLPRQRGAENQGNDYHSGAPSVDSYDDLDDYDDHEREYGNSPYDYYNTQEVPPPLKYVPYQPEKRGLSPIPSVSGYTEGSEAPNRDSRAFGGSVSSGSRTPENMSVASLRTAGMDRSNVSGMTNSEVDGNGHAVRAVGANPNYVHTSGVDSNHASFVEGSVVDSLRFSGVNQQPYRNSMATNGSQEADRPDTAGNDSQASYDYQEYDVDEYGRKVPRQRHYTTASEAAITSAAVGAAAAALRQQGKQENQGTSEWQGEGVQRNQSFKERAQNGSGPALQPKHSVDRMSDVSVPIKLGFSGLPDISSPLPDFEHWNEDDLLTNPSLLNGEEGGEWEGDATPKQRPQSSVDDFNYRPLDGTHDALQKGLNLSGNQQSGQEQDEWYRTDEDRKRDTLVTNPYEDASPIANLAGLGDSLLSPGGRDNYDNATRSPVGQKVDEGYISQGPNKTPDTSMDKGKGLAYGTPLNLGSAKNQNPMDFFGSGSRQVSGMSDGMDSQMYDPATGTGIDKIESKDIMALMQHLMVRDAQRSARDTEILVTLVRAATEMRNNFEDLKRLLADTEDVIITEVKENTEKTVQRAINGPRPYPGSAPRSLHSNSQAGTTTTMDEMSNKKQKNIFRRALMKGLGHKGPNDLGRIEDMLMQLLTQVDVLKSQTVPGAGSVPMSHQDERSYENMQSQGQYEQDRGYEPEGHAGTSTNSASQSGQLSIQSRGTSGQQNFGRKVSGHRISTVPEDNEDEYDNESIRFGGPEVLMTPAQEQRSGSLQATPRGSPPTASGALQMSPGYENTRSPAYENPQSPAYEKTRSPDYQQQYESTRSPDYQNAAKQNEDQKKKGRSSWFKSRWSESTTTTNITQLFRRSGQSRKEEEDEQQWSPIRPAEQPTMPTYRNNTVSSRADSVATSDYSDMFQFSNPHPKPKPNNNNNPYSQGRGPSHDVHEDPESPVLAYNSMQPPQPNWVTMTPEEAKYKAHRNSLNLVHPQPRQGQTERFKQALESQALGFTGGNSPMLSPKSEDWAGSATSLNRLPRNLNRDSFDSQGNEANPNWQQIYGSSSPAPASLNATSGGPPRPPKEPIDGSTGSGPNSPSQARRLENKNLSGATGQVSRRPSGPRPMTPSNDREGRGSGGNLSEGSRRTGSLLRD